MYYEILTYRCATSIHVGKLMRNHGESSVNFLKFQNQSFWNFYNFYNFYNLFSSFFFLFSKGKEVKNISAIYISIILNLPMVFNYKFR